MSQQTLRQTQSLIYILCVSSTVRHNNLFTIDMNGITDHMLVLCELQLEKNPDYAYTLTIKIIIKSI